MAPSYNMTGGQEAWVNVSQGGTTSVSVRSASPIKPRAVYVGSATLDFMWVSTGKSTHWQFTPRLIDPTPAQYNETKAEADQTQVINVDLGNRMFPAAGIVRTNLTGQIKAAAIQFDLPYATDVWVFLLRSPWFPLKVVVEKTPLSIMHGSAQAVAQLESGTTGFNDASLLKAYVSTHGEGFKNVQVSLERQLGRTHIEEVIGVVGAAGMDSFTWKPFLRNFDVALVAPSTMGPGQFVDFLRYLGADAKASFFSFGNYMPNDFLLCDGPAMDYTLRLRGEKHILGHEEDTTRVSLTS